MKTYLKLSFVVVSMLTTLMFTSCCDDKKDPTPSPEPINQPSIIGEWIEDASDGDVKLIQTTEFKEDGTTSCCYIYVNTPNSIYTTYTGNYTYSDKEKKITHKYESFINGSIVKEIIDIQSLEKYTLTAVSSEAPSAAITLNRIVDTYQMKIGETKTISLNDVNFVPTGYKSNQKSVAQVDESGNIFAVKQGITFVRVTSETGTAVIRVIVTDPNNAIDDYLLFMGGAMNTVTEVYGNGYMEIAANPLTERTYALMDEKVEKVVFGYFSNIVMMASVYIRESADINAIVEVFDKKYENKSEAKTVRQYIVENNDAKWMIFIDISDRSIVYVLYTEPTPTPAPVYADDDFLASIPETVINMTASDAAEFLGHEITEDEWSDGWFDYTPSNTELFQSISVMFDEEEEPHDVYTIMMYTQSGVNQEDIEDWYKAHYIETGDALNPYSNASQSYYIRFKTSGSRLIVYYSKRKARR